MKSKKNRFPIEVIFLTYLLPIAIFVPFAILFTGYIDLCIVIGFGILNTIITYKLLKTKPVQSFLIGFFISSFSLIFIYALWQLLDHKLRFGFVIYIILSLLSLYYLKQKTWDLSSRRKVLILAILTISSVILAINLNDYYPQEFEKQSFFTFKVVDVNQNAMIGNKVEISIERNQLFDFYIEEHKIADLITNRNGEIKISMSEGANYVVSVYSKKYKYGKYFHILSLDLKTKNEFNLMLE